MNESGRSMVNSRRYGVQKVNMNKKDLFRLYEKLYFHEIDMRENLSARLQIPLAILVVLIGFIAYMLRNISPTPINAIFMAFLLFYCLCIVFIVLGILFLVRSWLGYEYTFLPSAKDTEDYRALLIETYKSYENSDELVQKYMMEYIYRYFIECSSTNTVNNDNRSMNLHYARISIICSLVLAFIAFIPFHFGGIDRASLSTPTDVRVVEPIELKDTANEQKRPKNSTKTSTTASEENNQRRRQN